MAVILISDIAITLVSVLAIHSKDISFYTSFKISLPESTFYLVFGLLVSFVIIVSNNKISKLAYAVFVCFADFFSNIVELSIRIGLIGLNTRVIIGLFIIAIVRSVILWIILSMINKYRLTLLKKSNAERYERLVVLMSKLTSEMAWMDKGTVLVEDTMKEAYSLYSNLQNDDIKLTKAESATLALNVAKNVHEIKKEYILIMRGLSEAIGNEAEFNNDNVENLILLIGNSVFNSIEDKSKRPTIEVQFDNKLITNDTYVIISIFDNLISNAVEAADRRINISITQTSKEDNYIFSVSDDGDGIPEDIVDDIFVPGISTKIDFETGVVSRGLGLAIVKELVEDKLDGSVKCLTSSKKGTTFELVIPKKSFKVEA
ncbi:MAG: sensor histidine kinase [Firmicutes bacterium]|nr:sensor histidine kinase [Bacillota bacterium]